MTTHESDDLQLKMQRMVKQMAEFTALYETVAENMHAREQALEQQLNRYHQFIEEKMHNLELMLGDFENILTQAGAARWRLAAEQALAQGESHLAAIQEMFDAFNGQVQSACYGLEKTSTEAAQRFQTAAKSLQLDELKKATSHSTATVDKLSTDAIKKINAVARLFHWERFGMAVVVALLAALVTGMFLNDETPIESHKKAMAERQAGRVLMAAWPNLNDSERERIQQVSNA